jgi:cytochrome d ubiquinol oxidase subunit II
VALVRYRTEVARVCAAVAVGAVLVGWGVAQYPWVLVDTASIEDVAAGRATLWALVITFGLAAVTVVPALAYMLVLTQRSAWQPEVHAGTVQE